MEVEKQTKESSIKEYNSSDHELSFIPDSEVIKSKPSTEILKDSDATYDKTEQEKSGVDTKEDYLQCSSKNYNIRESHETSPFKQAVKGFVLSKLSKKVGQSHILSGITEKLVKKLEDNKDTSQPAFVNNSGSDLNLSTLKASETPTEVLSSSLSCELKSVVANDLALLQALNVEDAVECVEEQKSLISNTDVDIKIPKKSELRSSSISLPCSPAHFVNKRSSSVSYSLENVELTRKNMHSPNLSFLCEDEARCISTLENNENTEKEIDSDDKSPSLSLEDNIIDSEETYPNNAYSSKKEDRPELKKNMLKEIYLLVLFLKNEITSLPLSHFFLLASIVIHNIDIIPSYAAFIFDGIVIAYVCYSYICIVVQKPIPSVSNFPFADPQLENASLCIQKANKTLKGSVKVLKGEYDPEMGKNHPTDLVDISIENCCLKISAPKKKSKDVSKDISTNSDSVTFYDLLGANVSIIPKDLSKKRTWNRKYPLCITFSSLHKHLNTDDFEKDDEDSTSTEYLSIANCENSVTEKKALYLFALTDREKELFFWALKKNTENDIVNSEQSPVLSKPDLSFMSYSSLLDSNNDDDISQSKDEDENSSTTDKTNVELDFECYMRDLFENFEKMNKFTPRSRSFEELSILKDDASRSEAHFSKDDSCLLTSTRAFSVDWLNVACGRVFYDFLTQKKWNDEIKARIQKKLDKIEMPSFIESLEVNDVFLGTSFPQVYTVSNPIIDIYGVWFNCDFNYCGSFQMTLKTKLKMAKAKQFASDPLYATEVKQNVLESESSDEEGSDSKSTSPKKKKLINRIEKWISHKHFQTVAQNRFVKKYVGDLSNMPLTLTVEVSSLHGTLSINIPPAPTDRIWYGFRKDPVLSLRAYPKVGTHEINLSAIVQMIEKKLIQEFKKAIVLPNMDDLLIPVMHTPIYEL